MYRTAHALRYRGRLRAVGTWNWQVSRRHLPSGREKRNFENYLYSIRSVRLHRLHEYCLFRAVLRTPVLYSLRLYCVPAWFVPTFQAYTIQLHRTREQRNTDWNTVRRPRGRRGRGPHGAYGHTHAQRRPCATAGGGGVDRRPAVARRGWRPLPTSCSSWLGGRWAQQDGRSGCAAAVYLGAVPWEHALDCATQRAALQHVA
jgi:hypothetical protein